MTYLGPHWLEMTFEQGLLTLNHFHLIYIYVNIYVYMYVRVGTYVYTCVCMQILTVVSYWLEGDVYSKGKRTEGRLPRFYGGYMLPDNGKYLILVYNSFVSHLCRF